MIAYSNGKFIPAGELTIAPQDMGFMLGVTVPEQLRTFAGEIFEPQTHMDRFRAGLDTVAITGVDPVAILDAAGEVVENNFKLLPPKHDLGVTVFATPGIYASYRTTGRSSATVGIHTHALPFGLWSDKYKTGQVCELSSIPQIPRSAWPRDLKCRSRMHYYLADLAARKNNPAARAILLDEDGNVNEASTCNVVAHFEGEGLVSPPLEDILQGVSLRVLESLAEKLDMQFQYRPIASEELSRATEILLTSTPFCILPVSQLGEQRFSERTQFQMLIDAWSQLVGLDIIEQAVHCSKK